MLVLLFLYTTIRFPVQSEYWRSSISFFGIVRAKQSLCVANVSTPSSKEWNILAHFIADDGVVWLIRTTPVTCPTYDWILNQISRKWRDCTTTSSFTLFSVFEQPISFLYLIRGLIETTHSLTTVFFPPTTNTTNRTLLFVRDGQFPTLGDRQRARLV